MKNKGFLAVAAVGTVIVIAALLQIGRITLNKYHTSGEYEKLKQYTEIAESDETADDTAPEKDDTGAPVIQKKYVNLFQMNSDFVGWLKVDGTKIDYPVMQTVKAPEYYLNHAFSGREDSHGVPFMDAGCSLLKNDNFIIHGHNMLDGTMFDDLSLFAEKGFCEKNRQIRFDTVYEDISWKTVLVFKITFKDTEAFPYYTYTNFEDSKHYDEFVEKCKNYAVWYDEDEIKDAAQLLILSTCDNSYDNGRIVVLAKRLDNQ